jgi:hypothetical protein
MVKNAFDTLTAALKDVNSNFQTYNQDVIASLTKNLDNAQDATFTALAKVADDQIKDNRATITR